MSKYDVLVEKAMEMIESDDEIFVALVNELDSWNGYADGFRCYSMYEIDDICCGMSATDLLEKLTGDFNIRDDYFYFSIWGLESTDNIAELYRDNVDEGDLFDEVLENMSHIDLDYVDGDFAELMEEIDNYDEDDEDED